MLTLNHPRQHPKVDLKIEILKNSTLFSCIEAAELHELTPVAVLHHFARNEAIFHQGDAADSLHIVACGKVKQYKHSRTGRTFTVAIMSSGDPLNASAMFGTNTYFVSAEALNETTVLTVPRKNFLTFVEGHPAIAMRLVGVLGKVLSSGWERLADLAGETADQRLFNILYMLYSKFGETIPVTREEIADMAGTTTETAIRVLSKLKQASVIESGRGQITVINEAKLRLMGQCAYPIVARDGM